MVAFAIIPASFHFVSVFRVESDKLLSSPLQNFPECDGDHSEAHTDFIQ